jgi:hypothetical protein
MFALNPDGTNKSDGKAEPGSKKYIHFLKLGLYFAAIRAAHVYFGPSGTENQIGSQ